MPTLNGTIGNDYIDVTARIGAGVAAMVMAGAGVDRVVGGTGNDTLYGEDGNDQLVGNAGNDLLIGGDGSDQMSGGADNDTLDGGIGNDTMGGDAGDDSLAGGLGMDALTGGDGNDTLDGGDDSDSLSGNAGNDLLLAGAGDDRANGGAGNDTVYGGLGADTIDGNLDNDLVYGEDGNDTLTGGDGNDTVDGGIDNDIVMGGAGDDVVYGGDGDDTLEGGLGLDSVYGGAGNDLVKQTVAAAPLAGLDMVDGGSGTDTLHVALSLAQWQTAGIKADLAGLAASFASPLGQTLAYTASSLGFSAVRFENLMVSVDGNYAPTAIALSASTVAENAVAGAIGTLTTADATLADTFTYTVDDNRFEVVDGVLSLKAGVSLDYEAASSVALNVTSTDSSGLAITRAFTVAVTNVNEAPVVTSGATASFAENGTGPVYTATATDPDAGTTFSYTLSGADAGLFNIDSSTGVVTFKAAPNFEVKADAGADNVYDVNILASDGALTASKALAITVTNVNEGPTVTSGATVNFAENGTGPVYTATATDPDAGTTFSYALSGADAGLFNIDSTTGVVTFKAAPNFEVKADAGANNVYDVNILASDGALTASKALAITVTNVNETPVVSAAVATKYATAGTATSFDVSTAFTDPDAGDTLTWSATSTLPTGVTFNATTHVFSVGTTATAGLTSITIKAQDGAGLFATNTFTLSVSDATTVSGGVTQGDSHNNFLDYRGAAAGVNVDTRQGDDTIYGSNFADTLNGGTGNNSDHIYGGAGNDALTSGSGTDNDIFWYAEANSGNDTITDFTKNGAPPRDQIGFDISDTGVASMANLSIGTAGGVVVISWGAGTGATGTGSITLTGVTNPALFTAADFLFVA